jgi:hypothetical protein
MFWYKNTHPANCAVFHATSRRFCATLLCVLLLSGCDILKGLGFGGDKDESSGTLGENPFRSFFRYSFI